MIVAGCDIGSLTAKAVIMQDGAILGSAVTGVHTRPERSAEQVMHAALEAAGLAGGDVGRVVGTGYGRKQVSFFNAVKSEIACHARGAWHLHPAVRTVIDIGGQDSKATRVDENGNVTRYFYNDKCAAGTGRFLEMMAETLEVPLEQLGAVAAESTRTLTISNQCVIFAETEVISLVARGAATSDILHALHQSLARRVAALAAGVEVTPDVVMTGGVAKNPGVVEALSAALGVPLTPLGDVDPQIVGAIGAALFAREAAG